MPKPLDIELETYERERDRLLSQYEGKYVLIHDEEVVGAYESEIDAIHQGYDKFGNVPFLVKQVLPVEIPLEFVSGHLDL